MQGKWWRGKQSGGRWSFYKYGGGGGSWKMPHCYANSSPGAGRMRNRMTSGRERRRRKKEVERERVRHLGKIEGVGGLSRLGQNSSGSSGELFYVIGAHKGNGRGRLAVFQCVCNTRGTVRLGEND